MQRASFLRKVFLVITIGLLGLPVYARTPIWTFTPLSATRISLAVNGTAIVQYTVTNQSHKSHTLQMKPIRGVTTSGCNASLGYLQSCTLSLQVNGSFLQGDVLGGPVLCEQRNPLLCYQPNQQNSLNIRLKQQPPLQQYTVTSSAEANGSISPNGTQVVSPGATLTFTAAPNTNYGVNQWLVDGNLVQTGGTSYQLANISANHSVSVNFSPATLSPSVSTMALSVTNTAFNSQLIGNARQIRITNSGAVDAVGFVIEYPSWPGGSPATIASDDCGNTLAARSFCTITVTPGSAASTGAGNVACSTGILPNPSTIRVSANNVANSVLIDVVVLSYGCQYQGGYLYSVDDATLNTGSIGGKVAALTDSVTAPINELIGTPNWGGNGCDIGSSLWNNNPQGGLDGAANSASIVDALTTNYSGSPCNLGSAVSLNDYAAGICKEFSTPFDKDLVWYLPSMCELSGFAYFICNGSMRYQLSALTPSVGNFVFNGIYWSSTEAAALPSNPSIPSNRAISARWSSGSGSILDSYSKENRFGVRCSRALNL